MSEIIVQPDDSLLIKHEGVCHLFTPVSPVDERSFTISFSMLGNAWVFYHDYIPDFYFHTRKNLYSLMGNSVYRHNDALPGITDKPDKVPFFIDIVFAAETDILVESVRWVTETIEGTGENMFGTFTHITIWNSYQHSGRITVTQLFEQLGYRNITRTKGEWNFNDFYNILKANQQDFLSSVFQNLLLSESSKDASQSWFDKAPFTDKWVCVRFEFDNSSGSTLLVHDLGISAIKQAR